MPEKNLKLKIKNRSRNKKTAVDAVKAVAKKPKKIETLIKPIKATTKSSTVSLSVSTYGLDGKNSSKISLPKEIFGQRVNKALLAQAVRIYQANKRQGNASTKTRSEVEGSSRKIYQQKGTGRARHGTLRAPIFVKGGIVHGPKPRDFSLDFPKKMRKKALFSALSAKLRDEGIRVVSGLGKIDPKTKKLALVLDKLNLKSERVILVIPDSFESAKRGSRNLGHILTVSSSRLNALDILKNKYLLLAKESIEEMEKFYLKK